MVRDVPRDLGGLPITGFSFQVNGFTVLNQSFDKGLAVVLRPLRNATTYALSLCAVNDVGPGKYSEPLLVRTTENYVAGASNPVLPSFVFNTPYKYMRTKGCPSLIRAYLRKL